jgi:hypothetical protein
MIQVLLKRYKYPPDQEAAAVELVLQQKTEMISEEWAREGLGIMRSAALADGRPKPNHRQQGDASG